MGGPARQGTARSAGQGYCLSPPGLLCQKRSLLLLVLQVLIGSCQRSVPHHQVIDLMKLLCCLQHTLQILLVPTRRVLNSFRLLQDALGGRQPPPL